MNPDTTDYEPLTVESLSARLRTLDALSSRVGKDPASWNVQEVGDGNLNLVFIVSGPAGSVIVKQALPYVRLVGESWPLPLKRVFFEYHALTRQAARDPGVVPEIFYFDETQAILVMEFLTPHTILRGKLIAGHHVKNLAATLGQFCARCAFKGSDLHLATEKRKADAALFLDNAALCGITEDLVFTAPYYDAEMNHHTDGLDTIVTSLRADVQLKTQVQHLLMSFAANSETLCHGDLHSGSVMCTENDSKMIDPEFAFYGPMGFDLGMLMANFLMAYFSQPAHRNAEELDAYQNWILQVIEDIHSSFIHEFSHLWHNERFGILYSRKLFEDQGHSSESALADKLADLWRDAVGFCGVEMHRRILSLAHNADFESIENTGLRASLEARNLLMGRELILTAPALESAAEVTAMARSFSKRDIL